MEIEVLRILNSVDKKNEVFKILDVRINRTLPLQYYLEKERKRRGIEKKESKS